MLNKINSIYPIGSKDQPFYKKQQMYKDKALLFKRMRLNPIKNRHHKVPDKSPLEIK